MLHKKRTLQILLVFFIPLIVGFIYGKIFLHTSSIVQGNIEYNEVLGKILAKNLMCVVILVVITFFGHILIKTFLGMNGLIAGLLISKFKSISYLLLVLPHGIVEIPTFLFLGYVLLGAIERNKLDFQAIKGISVSAVLIVLGALIETYVTPNIVNSVLF
ncbi:stage II sporulation protein M [Priestia megaterium]|uniref:stage II sporulation protein M n=1 Tax=Priestia megaterium TaxID=1404 RepID=UPI001F462C55|nr:stage II sporulation protein M [Priestia megaterium]MCF8890944.1 stage II sporulation protein M [Priestia megaterium]